MLPPISALLRSEVDAGAISLDKTSIPGFVNLFRHLTEQTLDHDASTGRKNRDHENSRTAARLRQNHVDVTRDVILLRTLQELCLLGDDDDHDNDNDDHDNDGEGGSLPRRMLDLCYVVTAYLSSVQTGSLRINREVEDLMAEELSEFRDELSTIAAALESRLKRLEGTVVELMAPLAQSLAGNDPVSVSVSGSGSTTHASLSSRIPVSRTVPARKQTDSASASFFFSSSSASASSSSASLTHQTLQTQHHIQTTTLPALLASLSTALHALLTAQSQLLTAQIRHSELHTHSTVSRNLTGHAAFLGAVAQGLNLKAQILALQREKEAYAEEGVREGLRVRFEALVVEERGLTEREDRIRGLLAEYGDAAARAGQDAVSTDGVGAEGVFEQLGKGYAEVEREIEIVRMDVERLEAEMAGDGDGYGRKGGGKGGTRRR